MDAEGLLRKISALPPDKVAEVEDFVDFLKARDQEGKLGQVTAKLSEQVFEKVWNNPDDAEYDRI